MPVLRLCCHVFHFTNAVSQIPQPQIPSQSLTQTDILAHNTEPGARYHHQNSAATWICYVMINIVCTCFLFIFRSPVIESRNDPSKIDETTIEPPRNVSKITVLWFRNPKRDFITPHPQMYNKSKLCFEDFSKIFSLDTYWWTRAIQLSPNFWPWLFLWTLLHFYLFCI